jgi:hypothetical protein
MNSGHQHTKELIIRLNQGYLMNVKTKNYLLITRIGINNGDSSKYNRHHLHDMPMCHVL